MRLSAAVTSIVMLGFESRSLKAFEIFFRDKCGSKFNISDDCKSAPLALVDIDVVRDQEKLRSLKKSNPDIIVFALSISDQIVDIPGVYCLKKPISYLDLKKELMAVRKSIVSGRPFKKTEPPKNIDCTPINSANKPSRSRSLSNNKKEPFLSKVKANSVSHSTSAAMHLSKKEESYFVGSLPDVNLSSPHDVLKIVYSNDHKLQLAITKAIKAAREYNSPVQMVCLGVGIIIDPITELIHTAVNENILRPICLLDVEKIDSFKKVQKPINGDEILAIAGKTGKKLITSSIESFVWKIALWTSRGKVPKTVDLNTPVYLSEWPNFTRLQIFPHSMRIAAFLIQQPCKLGDISEDLGVPQRYVFSFFSAANAIGISNVSARQIDSILRAPVEPKKTAPRKFLNKILSRLIGVTGVKEELRNEL